ncbi:MAG TPA: MarR family winged helix-turn-helix transcriptional regulator [Acidimicrobiales bacterium]|nr:MarR family winged helix-turn-helix transcriptional regulator [Acidimicrobiales bacterium]
MSPPLPHVGRLVRRAQQVHNRLWGKLVSEEVTSPQFAVLFALAETDEADQRTIGRSASLDRSTVADVVDRMVRRGYLERRRDPEDQRRNLLRLSPEGRSLLVALMARGREMNEALLGTLDETERVEFLRLLTKFVALIEAMDGAEGEAGGAEE